MTATVAGAPARIAITSADGTRLSVDVRGEGPPLVLVHGIAGAADRWVTSHALAAHFTLYALDRRGRGESADGPTYSLAREVDDVVAVLERAAADAPSSDVALFGHSFGGLLALEAASSAPTALKQLLVYEPYAPETPEPSPSATTRSFEALIADREAILERFLREIVHMPEPDLVRFRQTPAWSARLDAAPTIPREMAAVECHRLDISRLRARGTRVRFLLGERSPAFLKDATARLHESLPGSSVVPLPGQGHVAMDTAPALFEAELRSFFGK